MRVILGPLLAAVAALAIISPAQADPAAPRMPLGRATTPPVGYVEFCAAHPADCGEQATPEISPLAAFWRQAFLSEATSAIAPELAAPDDGAHVALTAEALHLLNAVNREVNAAIAPANDIADGRRTDIWSLPLAEGRGAGDCEDYVLEKRRALIGRGLAPKALSIAVVRTRWGESHAVLLVDTDAGELVLDNRSSRISAWTEVDYRWLKRQTPANPSAWVRIGAL